MPAGDVLAGMGNTPCLPPPLEAAISNFRASQIKKPRCQRQPGLLLSVQSSAYFFSRNAACAAARRAMGTRGGEQLT
jgi:hypothetical protein